MEDELASHALNHRQLVHIILHPASIPLLNAIGRYLGLRV